MTVIVTLFLVILSVMFEISIFSISLMKALTFFLFPYAKGFLFATPYFELELQLRVCPLKSMPLLPWLFRMLIKELLILTSVPNCPE